MIRLRPSLPAVLLATSVVVSVALAGLVWRVLADLDRRRTIDQVDSATDAMAAGLRGRFAETGDTLSAWLTDPAAPPPTVNGAVVVTIRDGRSSLHPDGRLPYVPEMLEAEIPVSVFEAAERLENAEGQPAAAAAHYRQLVTHRQPEIRVGALARLGRALRKAREFDEAAAAYDRLVALGDVRADGLPAALYGLDGQRLVHRARGDSSAERQVAERIVNGLDKGEWAVTRGMAEFYRDELTAAARPPQWLLAAAASDLRSHVAGTLPLRGLRITTHDDRSVITQWRTQGGATALSVAFADDVLAATAPDGVRWQLRDADDRRLTGEPNIGAPASTRVVGQADGSWTLAVWPDPARPPPAEPARVVLIGMTSVMFLLLWGATYFITRALRREAEVARLQKDFVAAVSHEFRSPLSTIRQMSEMLEGDRIPSEQRRREFYSVLSAEAARLQRLVETLLNFGRMEAGAERYRMADLDAGTLVQAVVADLEPQAREAGTSIDAAGPDVPVRLRGDEDALRLALRNLVENAIKYSPQQPVVWVRWGLERDRASIKVVDHGVGIAADERSAIFGKFVRGRSAQAADVKGTGVGLAMVQHIALAHGGEVRVESEVGKGSTFILLLPVAS